MLKTLVQEFAVRNGPYGGMSIGESPVVPVAGAIANAVAAAVGVRIYDLPITAEKVLSALKTGALGGHQIEYEDEAPLVRQMFAEACAKAGIESQMGKYYKPKRLQG